MGRAQPHPAPGTEQAVGPLSAPCSLGLGTKRGKGLFYSTTALENSLELLGLEHSALEVQKVQDACAQTPSILQ